MRKERASLEGKTLAERADSREGGKPDEPTLLPLRNSNTGRKGRGNNQKKGSRKESGGVWGNSKMGVRVAWPGKGSRLQDEKEKKKAQTPHAENALEEQGAPSQTSSKEKKSKATLHGLHRMRQGGENTERSIVRPERHDGMMKKSGRVEGGLTRKESAKRSGKKRTASYLSLKKNKRLEIREWKV